MNKRRSFSLSHALHWGALEIAGIYLIIGALWILFSDQIAEKIALNAEMLATISLYKGWTYVLITALLLYWLIQRHTARLRAGKMQLQRVLDALPALISYIDKDQHYRFTNSAYQDWFEGQTLGKHIQEVIGTSAYQSALKYIDKVLGGETVRYETEVFLPGGERFISAIYVPDIGVNGRVEGFFTLVHDVTEQKQTLEERRQWADAFEGCAHGIAVGDPNTNRIVVCNPAFANLHKSRVEDIVGSAVLSLYAASDHEHVRRNVQKADQIGHARFEAKMTGRGKDSSTFPVEMDVVSILGEDGEVLHRVVTAQDISERKRAQEKLKESEAKYRILVEHLPAITYISEPEQYMGVSYISPQIESFGFDVRTWLADPEFWFRQIHPDDQERVQSELQKFQAGAESFKTEYRLMLPDGETRWFHDKSIRVKDQSGKTILKQGFMLDITESKQAEAALKESEDRYRIVSELTSDYAYKDRVEEDGSIVPEWITESFTRITGYTLEEARSPGFWQRLVYPDDIPLLLKHVEETLSGQPHTLETRVITKSGEIRWLRDYSNPAWDTDQNRVVGLFGAVQDITERKQGEEYLRRFELLSKHSRDIILFMGHKDGRILEANAAAEQAYGYSRDELLSLTVRDLRAPNTLGLTADQMAQADAGGILFETIHRRKDGTTFPVEVSSQGATINGVRTLISIVRDISERKKAEEALRQGEQRLKRAQEIAHLGSWEFDLINNRLTWSDEVYRIFGLQPQEFAATYEAFLEAVHPDDRTAVDAAYSDSIQVGRDSYEIEHRVIDQSSRQVRIVHEKCEHYRNAHGQVFLSVGMVHDITERKNAEKALTESESRFRSLFEQSADANLLLENGIFTDCNPATVQMMHAKSKEEILSSRPSELSPKYQPDGRLSSEKADKLIRIALENGSNRFEWIHRRKDGTDFPVEVLLTSISTGDRQVIHAVWRNITERKQIEQALQAAHDELEIKVQQRTAALSEANALLQALMDNLPDHIYFKDTQSRFIRNSRSQASLLGLNDPSEATGKTDFDFFPHAAKSYAEEQEVMRSGNPLLDFEEWVVWPDGRETWVLTTKLPLRNSEGQTIGIFGISHDITERKRAEQAIRQLNADLEKQTEQLQAANKELEAFSYSVSHDLRAPLRAIDGYTRILVEDYESTLDDEGKRVCGVISREARRMGQLIDDLLAFSHLGRKEMFSSKIEMRALVVSVLNDLLKEEERERIDIHIANLHISKGDSSMLRQVWVNLLANAIKFTSKKERAVIEVGGKTTKDELIYYVRDNGAGFEMEYVNKLFGVFQRLHSESEFSGTGVGLAIVQRIIRRHDGRVWAEGEVEKGATFYFALPRKEKQS